MTKRAFDGRQERVSRLGLLAILAVVALLLGFIGYLQSESTLLDSLYGTLSLLALNYTPPQGDVPWTLQVARFMAPSVAAAATFAALASLLEDQWNVVLAKRRRNHTVVCGLGRRGVKLALGLERERRGSCIAVESDPTNPNIKTVRDAGALVVVGDATDPSMLRSASIQGAANLVAVCSSDDQNAAVATAAQEAHAGGARQLSAYCHLSRYDLVPDLMSAIAVAKGEGFFLDWFSVSDVAARLLLSENEILFASDRDPPSIAIVGSDDLAEAIVVNAARQWHLLRTESTARLSIRVAAPDAADMIGSLRERYPAISTTADITAVSGSVRPEALAIDASGLVGTDTVFVCAANDTEGLICGLAIAAELGSSQRVIVRLVVDNPGFVGMLTTGGEPASVRLFSLIETTCTPRMVREGVLETLARSIHGTYAKLQPRDPADGTPVPEWVDLDEDRKEASRAHAQALFSTLSRLGCTIRPLRDWDTALVELAPGEIEALAVLEHERWSSERKLAGWRASPETDRSLQRHRWIDVPFGELPKEIADIDRELVAAVPRIFAAAGYEVIREGSSGSAPEPRPS